MRAAIVVLAVIGSGCDRGKEPPAPAPAAPAPAAAAAAATFHTVNELFAAGPPTFVAGTSGSDRDDVALLRQIGLVSDLFPGAAIVADTDVARGWPARPVVYGGPHVNAALAGIATQLPFELGPGRLAIGGEVFTGDDIQLIAAVPASAAHAEFVLYAGTGTPGVAEINGTRHGTDSILIADRFGRLRTGGWKRSTAGAIVAELSPPARRIEWRTAERSTVRVHFPAPLAPASDDDDVIAASVRGLATAIAPFGGAPAAIDLYVYPDRRSKESLTGNAGDGHATVAARSMHVLRVDPAAGGPLESLIAHEAVHIYAYDAWGAPGTPFIGEGLAVWISGQYGGKKLAAWRTDLRAPPAIADLVGSGFRRAPEATAYPVAGLTIAAAVDRIGIDGVRDHLYGATAQTWDDACARAGIRAADLESALPPR